MKWFLIFLACLTFLAVNGTISSLANEKLKERAAAGRRDFCAKLSVGDVAGAVAPMPGNSAYISLLSNTGKIAECGDKGLPIQIVSYPQGACRQLKQDMRVKWASGVTVDVGLVYACIPVLGLEYTDIERANVAPAKP